RGRAPAGGVGAGGGRPERALRRLFHAVPLADTPEPGAPLRDPADQHLDPSAPRPARRIAVGMVVRAESPPRRGGEPMMTGIVRAEVAVAPTRRAYDDRNRASRGCCRADKASL